MIDKKQLCKFLVQAKKSTYAAGDQIKKVIKKDKSTTLTFKQGDWEYHDNYFGGEPFGGREVVFFKSQPVYIMVYYGWVVESIKNFDKVYKMLQSALLEIPENKPYRGPEELSKGNYTYKNSFAGEIDNFSGEEFILENGHEVYRAKYMGGLVDQRK